MSHYLRLEPDDIWAGPYEALRSTGTVESAVRECLDGSTTFQDLREALIIIAREIDKRAPEDD